MLRSERRPSLFHILISLLVLSLLFTFLLIRENHRNKKSGGRMRERSSKQLTTIQLNRRTPILTAECPSRLGNQMFSYAILFAISVYNGRDAYMSPSMSSYISKYFRVSLNPLSKSLYNRIGWESRTLGPDLPKDIRNLPAKRTSGLGTRIKFCCYPQTWKYFHELRPRILQEFQFHEEIKRSAQVQHAIAQEMFYSTLPQANVTFIGVHVRRGDYVGLSAVAHFDLPTVDFYKNAVEYFDQKYENILYIVASDDVEWCQHHFGVSLSQYKFYYMNGTTQEHGGLDMAVLSSCDHIIFGLGTFGFWTAYLNPGEVIYCSNCINKNTTWMRAGSVYGGDYNNFVLPTWIGMTWNGAVE